MVRMQKRRRRTNKRGRRIRRRGMSTAPPRLSILSNARNLTIAYGYPVTDEIKRLDVTMNSVFTYGPNTGLPFQYREGRINSAKIYWQSDNATSDAGSVCLNVEDYGENTGTAECQFDELMSYPGSMVRKVWQNVSNRWFPTEPSDKEYRQLLGADGILTVTVRHSIKGSKLKGRILIMFNVRLRGKSTDRKSIAQQILLSETVAETTSEMEFVRIESIPA